MKPLTESKDIAVIGMAGRFPGAKNIQEFWENIENKIESIISFDKKELFNSGIPKDLLDDSNYIKSKGFLKNASMFDAKFFNINAH
ncbi:MAG: polyketide synthase involved in xenocoumacin synthesis, partial [uncultured bacterium]